MKAMRGWPAYRLTRRRARVRRVHRQQVRRFGQRLGNEQAVEGVAMVQRQSRGQRGMLRAHGKLVEAALEGRTRDSSRLGDEIRSTEL